MAHKNGWTGGWAALRLLAVLALMLGGVVPAAMAGGDHYSQPQPTVVYVNQSSNNCCRSYPATYHNGSGYGYSWAGFNSGVDTNNGYTGAFGADNTPHRADWLAKLQAQRQWDEKQYAKANGGDGAACGFTNSPAYCYKLMGPYPSELKIVRY